MKAREKLEEANRREEAAIIEGLYKSELVGDTISRLRETAIVEALVTIAEELTRRSDIAEKVGRCGW